MTINNDSLSRLAHATGMTDVEFDERSQVEAELACQQQIRRRMEDDRPTYAGEQEEFALMEGAARHDDVQEYYQHMHDPYADHDYGYHSLHDM
jgi:hypothetical protein